MRRGGNFLSLFLSQKLPDYVAPLFVALLCEQLPPTADILIVDEPFHGASPVALRFATQYIITIYWEGSECSRNSANLELGHGPNQIRTLGVKYGQYPPNGKEHIAN